MAGQGRERLTNGIYFHKAMSLLNRRLGRGPAALHLPHCWYFYGDEAVRSAMPYSVYWDHSDETITRVGWRGSGSFPDLDSQVRNDIDAQLQEIVREFPPQQSSLNGIIDAVYSYAPFEFQKKFRELKGEFYDILGSKVVFDEYTPRLLRPMVAAVLSTFPKGETVFAPAAEFLPTVQAATDVLLDSAAGQKPAYSLLVDFWEYFCYHLRTHPRAHESVPGQTLQFWEDQLEARRFDYLGLLGRQVEQLRTEFPTLGEPEVLRDLTATWTQARVEFDELLKDPALEG